MAGSFEVHGDGTITVAFAYTAGAAKVQATADTAAHRLYNTGRYVPVDGGGVAIPWDALTNQQKLDIVDKFVRTTMIELAREDLHIIRTAERDALRVADNATLMAPE